MGAAGQTRDASARAAGPRRVARTLARAFAAGAALVALAGCKGCSCKKETQEPVSAPPPPAGAASLTELTTGIGPASGWEDGIAPTSTKWERAFVLDDKRVILAGETTTEA
ncbi:MAG TPA: hypothetical protein VHB21_08645, partial [Minicystis sp.]|nr:hypothetical protein [Minicystis sp.]